MNTHIGRFIRMVNREMYARRSKRRLHQLDDRALADIGITRGGIESAVRRDFDRRTR